MKYFSSHMRRLIRKKARGEQQFKTYLLMIFLQSIFATAVAVVHNIVVLVYWAIKMVVVKNPPKFTECGGRRWKRHESFSFQELLVSWYFSLLSQFLLQIKWFLNSSFSGFQNFCKSYNDFHCCNGFWRLW